MTKKIKSYHKGSVNSDYDDFYESIKDVVYGEQKRQKRSNSIQISKDKKDDQRLAQVQKAGKYKKQKQYNRNRMYYNNEDDNFDASLENIREQVRVKHFGVINPRK